MVSVVHFEVPFAVHWFSLFARTKTRHGKKGMWLRKWMRLPLDLKFLKVCRLPISRDAKGIGQELYPSTCPSQSHLLVYGNINLKRNLYLFSPGTKKRWIERLTNIKRATCNQQNEIQLWESVYISHKCACLNVRLEVHILKSIWWFQQFILPIYNSQAIEHILKSIRWFRQFILSIYKPLQVGEPWPVYNRKIQNSFRNRIYWVFRVRRIIHLTQAATLHFMDIYSKEV